ncbi:MAG: UDP-N-acetylmuramoylalanyl-D-glutamate-2,6-diaminopimelate ligase [uncultured bacterium]|nr:MAG: UDP-N-acetylmuramoylalanyl-D-glutamate-2,6-diaminopimelate ligase [uncultured bacterium]
MRFTGDYRERKRCYIKYEDNFMHKLKKLFPQSIKNIYHLAQAILANVIFGFPPRKIRIIGVTGTDGKTTTVQMIAKILEESGKKVAMASTINFKIDGVEEKNLSHFTTESSFAVQKFIKKAVSVGCEYLVLETSSHSLDQYRVWGVDFDVALITNVTREHLDYHGTMEKYRQAKRMLFENVAKNKGTIVVNLGMENPEEFLDFEVGNKFGYCVDEDIKEKFSNEKINIIQAEKIEVSISSSNFLINNEVFTLSIPGEFNVENALAATCVGLGEGFGLETIKEALTKIRGVPGRLERVENTRGINILVDFALTPEALKRLYEMIAQTKKETSKIIAVFGSCGDRDKGKRPIMGKIVSEIADFVILTNDEPYHEKPEQIIAEIFAGIENKKACPAREGENVWKITDRRLAIRKALEIAAPDDVIAVTGMGNFETMVVGDKKIPWNDRQVIEEELQKLT